MNTTGFLSASALLLLLTACSAGSGTGEWAGTVRDSAGILIVENPSKGVWPDGEGWTVEEELRIGAFGGNPDYQFGQVGTVAVSSRGEILVSDTQAQDVRVFSPEGAYLRTVGGPGSGPGELGPGASMLLIAPGDTLLVPDPRNRRSNRYAPDGTSLGSEPLNPERGRALRYNLNPAGAMTAQLRSVQSASRPGTDSLDAIRIVETSGAFGDTIFQFPSGGLFQGPGVHYFTPEPIWEITDSLTLLFGTNSEYRIGAYGRDGSLRRIISRAHEPTLISDRDIQPSSPSSTGPGSTRVCLLPPSPETTAWCTSPSSSPPTTPFRRGTEERSGSSRFGLRGNSPTRRWPGTTSPRTSALQGGRCSTGKGGSSGSWRCPLGSSPGS
ncbi:MAG: 6-bladed beta-propeller, partial [Gemmatimonadota bacterium]